MKDLLLEITEIIDEEIVAYEQLADLYEQKKESLINFNKESLFDVDAQILEKAKEINCINVRRMATAKYLGDENIPMSEIIKKAQDMNNGLVEDFKKQKVKLGELSESLQSLESENMLLIKNGLTVNQKLKEIIVNVISPYSKQYGKDGRNLDNDERLVSFVEKEA